MSNTINALVVTARHYREAHGLSTSDDTDALNAESLAAAQEQMLRRRDAAGGEMEMFAKLMKDPKPDPKEVSDYISKLLSKEHISPDQAFQILGSMPRDPDGLRNWARVMFSAVMHEGIHAEAAFPRELYPSPPATNA